MSVFKLKYKNEYKALADRLRQARESARLTQVEVATKLNVPQSFVAKCESGERRVDVIELKVLASIYGCALTYFEDLA